MRVFRRSLALLLALFFVFASAPFAEAQTGTLVSNNGTRHTTCTALSSQAQAYYSGNYTYDIVSELAASPDDPMNSAMFNRLHTLMTDTMSTYVSYSSLVDYWPKTDANNGSANPVLFYSDELSGNFNREHVWPKSRGSFKESNGGSDLHHLRPTNADINSTRGNMTMGNVKGVYNTYKTKALNGGTVLWYNADADLVEVRDNIKGDVARILLYVWCRWQEPNLYENDPNPRIGQGDDANNGLKVIESLDTLLQWMKIDPVDTWEMSRNDQCENVQGNRNVFIDYPEYAWLLFGQTPPSDYRTPSGEAMNTSSFTLTAVANNAAWGSVSVAGRKITAVPNTGYCVQDATVSPANAAVLTRNGNVFTVSNLCADCTVTVNFAEKSVLTVSFDANGGSGSMAQQQVYQGDSFTLPANAFAAPDGMQFAGWKWSADNAVYQPNASVTIDADCTFTAQWTDLTDDATYVLVETTPSDWSGDYLIVYNAGPYAMNGSLTSLDGSSNYETVSLSGKTITVGADANNFYFTIEKSGNSYTVKSASGYYIGQTSNANGLQCSNTTAYTASLSLSGTNANIVSSGGAYLRFNASDGQNRFRFYKSSTYTGQKAISLYRRTVVTPPAAPAFKTQSLILSGQIGVNFYLDLPEINGVDYSDSYMTFAISGKGTTTERDDYDPNSMNQSKTYYGFTCYVNSIQMADTITATFHYGDGQSISKTYSILEYFRTFDEKIADNPNAFNTKTQKAVKAVADYGHYVQLYLASLKDWVLGTDYAEMNHCYTENYEIGTIRAAAADYAIERAHNDPDLDPIVRYLLILDSETTVRVFLKPASGYTGDISVTLDGNSVSAALQSDGRYLVELKNLSANQLSTTHTIIATTENGSATIRISALSYVNALFETSSDSTVQNAAAAIYSYAIAIDEYTRS